MEIKIIIVEDDKDLRQMLSTFFNLQADMNVVKTFSNGNLFLEEFKHLDCDVVLMDINMPGKNGIECIAEAKPLKPIVQFIVSTSLENHSYIFEALCSGATGYILKSDKATSLVDAVHDVMKGGSPMSPQIARLIVNSFQKPVTKTVVPEELSERETEIITYLSKGLNYKQISEKLFVSPDTVRTHIRNIYSKLHVKSKTEAINKVFPRN
jgi:DNA-binding NarL/FixJ family response regulator